MAIDSTKVTAATTSPEGSISGTIEFRDVYEPALNATIRVRVQDTGRADASASTVAEQVLQGVNIVPGLEPIPFEVHGIPQNPRARLTVRVHADVDNNGVVSRGDYVSTQSYPVEIGGEHAVLSIVARPVT